MWGSGFDYQISFGNLGRGVRGGRGRGRGRGQGRGRGKAYGPHSRNPKSQEPILKDFIDPNKVYICNISRSVTDDILKSYLCQYAPIVEVFIVRKRGHIQVSPFGFVTLLNDEDTQKILNLDGPRRMLYGKCMDFKPARKQFKLPGANGFQRQTLPDRDYDLEPANPEQPCIHVLIDDVLLRIFEDLPLWSLIIIERVCRRWQSLVHVCFRKKACQEIKGNLNTWLIRNNLIPSYRSISKVLILCGEGMTELSVAEVSSRTEGKVFRVIAQLCPALESLKLSNMSSIYNPHLQEFVSCCKNVKVFEIKEASSFNEYNLELVVTRLPHLEVLHLEGAEIKGECFIHLPTTMKELNLTQCNLVQSKSIEHIAARCHHLEVLILEGICIPASLLESIGKNCPNLMELGVEVDGRSPNVDMSDFATLRKLTYLGFSYSVNALITALPQLEELKLDGLISETTQDVVDFSILIELRTLILPWNNKASFSSPSLKTIASCTKLEKFKFKGSNENKRVLLELIRKCQFLRELDCPSITLCGEDIEDFVDANKRRSHRLKFVIGLDQTALDLIEKLNDAKYDVDMFDVHNLFSDFDVDLFDQMDADYDEYDFLNEDSDESIDINEANFFFLNNFLNDYDHNYPEYLDPLEMLMDAGLADEFYDL